MKNKFFVIMDLVIALFCLGLGTWIMFGTHSIYDAIIGLIFAIVMLRESYVDFNFPISQMEAFNG